MTWWKYVLGWVSTLAFTIAVIVAMCNRKFRDKFAKVYTAVFLILVLAALAINGPAAIVEIFTLGAAGHGAD